MWVPDYLHTPELWLDLLLAQVLVTVNAVFLAILLYQAKASRSFTGLPIPLMILAVAVLPQMRYYWLLQLWVFVILLFLYLMRDASDSQPPNGYVCFISLALCVLALWTPDTLWCIVYLWLVMLLSSAFSLRTIMASAIAVGVFAFYYGIAYYLGWVGEWSFDALLNRSWFAQNIPAHEVVTLAAVLIGTFAIAFAAFRRSSYGFVSTRMLLYHSVLLYLVATPLIVYDHPEGGVMCAMMAVATPAITSIYLLQKESESRGITFLVYVLAAVGLYAYAAAVG